jgi:hypothetical protein
MAYKSKGFNDPGPDYPKLGPAVEKFRRIQNPTWEQKMAHGEAVGRAICALQRRELLGNVSENPPVRDIGAWIRARHAADLARYPAKVRKARSPHEWEKMYQEAMGWTRKQLLAALSRQHEATK